jgi:AcrR family transcriptional regulator
VPTRKFPLRRTPSQERSLQTVDAILEATARVLTQDGFAACSTNRVAKVAGVSIGSLYQYFPDKDSLTVALLDREVTRSEDQVAAHLKAAQPTTVEAAARALVQGLTIAVRPRRALLKVLLAELHGVDAATRLQDRQVHQEARIATLLRAHQPELKARRPELAALLIVTLLSGVVRRIVVEQPEWLDDATLEEDLTRMILSYLRTG